ncbi:conserved hypothetical protein [Talaromyces stipitatus ATCC 10500]|uniref:NmrA-like domain-containing protein n=1 Tax=Talaromyces stipitatus (strain ATCC 10500 / CBS 375.48 / QM 6759 / NRRL 1006) TaxID=441959 RepID=B8M3Q1_TALSN|nr:uncharacterized protein TSTA_038500 [Talaromyces stipitatus ATCC 10500]EED20644.1 conserved hypothetical protein [Talaromyces stipitatus ATCC 10500]
MEQVQRKKIIIFGGTGAQGGSVVKGKNPLKSLCDNRQYDVSILTRDSTTPTATRLKETYNVTLIQGSYTTEEGLRAALKSQQICFFSLDSFNIGEPEEYFWTFRAYKIAVQGGLEWFIYSGTIDRFAK